MFEFNVLPRAHDNGEHVNLQPQRRRPLLLVYKQNNKPFFTRTTVGAEIRQCKMGMRHGKVRDYRAMKVVKTSLPIIANKQLME